MLVSRGATPPPAGLALVVTAAVPSAGLAVVGASGGTTSAVPAGAVAVVRGAAAPVTPPRWLPPALLKAPPVREPGPAGRTG